MSVTLLNNSCFPINFVKILRTPFYKTTSASASVNSNLGVKGLILMPYTSFDKK